MKKGETLNTKQALILGWMFCINAGLQGVTSGTLVTRFNLDFSELNTLTKTFVNQGNRDLIVRWKITDKDSMQDYSQESLLKRGNFVEVDIGKAFGQCCTRCSKSGSYEFYLELFQVKNILKNTGQKAQISKFKDSECVVQINKAKFLKHEVITFLRNKNGLLIYQASNRASN